MRTCFSHKMVARPFLPLLIALIAGLVLGNTCAISLWVPMGTALLCISFTGYAVFRNQSSRFLPIFLFISLGVITYQSMFPARSNPQQILYYTDRGPCLIQGEIVSDVKNEKGRQTFILSVISVSQNNLEAAGVSGKLRVTVAGREPELNPGDTLVLNGRIKPFRNFYNPGGFDYERYMAFQNTWGRVYVRQGMVQRIQTGEKSRLDSMRQAMDACIDRNVDRESARSVLKALLTGNRKGIPTELNDAFRKTGTSHLLAISGLHVGIIAAVSFGLLNMLLAWVPSLVWTGRVRKTASLLSFMPVLIYGVIAGMSPSTQRAVAMVSVVLLAHAVEAEHDILNTLAFAALLILAVSPGALFGVSFQLSFAAVLFIVWGMGTVSQPRDGNDPEPRSASRVIASYAWVSFFAYAGTLPLIMYYFNQVSLIGLLANVVLVPLVGFMVIPSGLLGLSMLPVSALISAGLIRFAAFFLGLSLEVIQWLSNLPFASIRTISPSILEMVSYYVLLALVLMFFSDRRDGRKSRQITLGVAMGLMVLVFVGDGVFWAWQRFFHRDLRVAVLDVGQGSANLIEFPKGHCMLIDGGGFSDNASFDMGEKVVAPYVWSRKIGCIDTVVMTHAESDHMNGLLFILEHFAVKSFWYSGQWKQTESCRRVRNLLEEKKISVHTVSELPETVDIGGCRVQILWPDPSGPMDGMTVNDSSVVIRIQKGHQSFLFTGDITEEAEKALVLERKNAVGSSVLVVPHHGSKTSSSKPFVSAIDPEFAVISAGFQNRFKMPHKGVLSRYRDQGATVLRTDRDGAILMRTLGDKIHITSVVNGFVNR